MQSGLLEQYVLGLTTEEESAEVEQYAAIFPEVEEEINLLRSAMKHYAQEQIAQLDSKNEKSAASSPTSSNTHSSPTSASHSRAIWFLAIGFLLSGVLSFHFYRQHRNSRVQMEHLRSNIKNIQHAYQADLRDLNTQLEFLLHGHTHYLQLRGTPLSPRADVRVFWNEASQKAFLQVLYLPPLPKGKQYHIWAGIEGEMKDLGLIHISEDHPQPIRCLPKANSLNITLEPESGSTQPHEDQLFARIDL